MKAILLAAGLGTRLRPITNTIPKCLVPIKNKPLLEWWFELLIIHGFNEILINTHYLAEAVEDFVRKSKDKINLNIKLVNEVELLGSAGTLKYNFDYYKDDEFVFVANADNYTNANLNLFIEEHKRLNSACTIGLFEAEHPSQCGIVEIDRFNKIISFEEKPSKPKSNLANAGIYCFSPEFINTIPNIVPLDIGKDILPSLNINYDGCGVRINGFLYDIGTIDTYLSVINKVKSGGINI